MSLVMIESSKFSAFAFAFDPTCRPSRIRSVAGISQQHVQHRPNLGNRQSRGIFFSPDAFPESKTTRQYPSAVSIDPKIFLSG